MLLSRLNVVTRLPVTSVDLKNLSAFRDVRDLATDPYLDAIVHGILAQRYSKFIWDAVAGVGRMERGDRVRIQRRFHHKQFLLFNNPQILDAVLASPFHQLVQNFDFVLVCRKNK